ncbi:MAG: tRNA (N6-threonylcarbamoyladenosine(37)-N6)-methyltransferase TrmO [Deltaproteobacteria bacterium]|nr:tRNA (N6-threonylcarbamoyladenosine(37)-N6)-methyltransferase TrmO [Deltaproteobacteria bacterium]
MEEFRLVPIGFVRSPYRRPEDAPHQGREAPAECRLEILEPYRAALEGIASRERLLVLCWLDRAPRDVLQVRPRGDPTAPLTGVFATRSPRRPNPIAAYVARLLEVRGTVLRVSGLDALDGTPILDLKPYVARLDE